MYTCKLQGFCLPNKENRKRHTCIYVPSEFFCVDYFNKCEFSEYRKYPTVRSAPYGSQSESIKRGTSLGYFRLVMKKTKICIKYQAENTEPWHIYAGFLFIILMFHVKHLLLYQINTYFHSGSFDGVPAFRG